MVIYGKQDVHVPNGNTGFAKGMLVSTRDIEAISVCKKF
ncbi:hypothetical protein C900_02672 [Fulvivirga imtechensis AK7]|uniref:Uncharacterized protein n=1 Tax=Fulvivirga imtechensis AK7 TaxID=1237149 RepID=L8K2B2_9BACT|nr:hypothetical protein C900_02672 [Fulvivirga imtechensis AK7]